MISMVEFLLFPPKILPKAEPVEDPLKPRSGNPHPNHVIANDAKIEAARKRYKAVMGEDWVDTVTIDARLGRGRQGSTKVLGKFVARGEMLCRPVGNEPYNRRKGYEWKWIK